MDSVFKVFSLFLSLVAATAAQSCTPFPTVDLGYARHAPTYVNQTTRHNISYAQYKNIRFAQPPVRDLRFRAPKTPPPTSANVQNGIYPRNATDCLISIPPGLAIAPGVEGASWGSEDCLFLDVKVPEGLQGGNVPVLHWLYGGGFIFGSKEWAGDPAGLFQDMMPDEKFITVSSNYRLGALGWMSSVGEDLTSNAGLWDALAALQWTKDYISYFGGDPDRITVIGESAGGSMAQHLLTMKGGQGEVPFSQAILTSPGYRPHVNRSQDMTDIYKLFLNATNCTDVSCLRNASTETISSANRALLFDVPSSGWLGPGIGYGPIIDGDLVPDVPDRLLARGEYHKTVGKVLTANMANDGLFAVVTSPTNWSDFLSVFMRSATPQTISRVEAMYPNSTGTAFDTFAKDAVFACHAYETAKVYGSDAYRYSMSIPPATHGTDQFYYFFTDSPDTPVELPQIARRLQKYFRKFILQGRTGGGDCSSDGEVQTPRHWPAYGGMGRWMNITANGFDLVAEEEEQARRCELLFELINDPTNGF